MGKASLKEWDQYAGLELDLQKKLAFTEDFKEGLLLTLRNERHNLKENKFVIFLCFVKNACKLFSFLIKFDYQSKIRGGVLNYQLVNDYLTSIFNNVLVIEESSLRASRFKDVSIKEMHTIDVIGSTPNATPSDISRS